MTAPDNVFWGPPPCHNCGYATPQVVQGLECLALVSSDCRPWDGCRRLSWCPCCGLVQKQVEQDFVADCCRIYDSYTVYHQSGGQEQRTFASDGGNAARSEHLLRQLIARYPLPDAGRLLDIGCGNGVLLKSFGGLKPDWRLTGLDLDERSREVILALPGVEGFHCCDLDEVLGGFNMVSLMHCLEHVPNPSGFLRKAAGLLSEAGLLLVEVPDFTMNPFDLTIADHCTHFTPESLSAVVRRAGFEPVLLEQGLVSKELTLLARRAATNADSCLILDSRDEVAGALAWLGRVLDTARTVPPRELGIFGTSIAGVWLYNGLGSEAAFFVDEDQSRVGRPLFGLPVISPQSLAPGQAVFLCFPPPIAKNIALRMEISPARFILPPEF